MRFHLLSVRTFFKDVPIRSIHSQFFHGKAMRGGAFPTSKDYRLNHQVDLPLRLHKNVYNIAHLFAPEFQLVISEQLLEKLPTELCIKSSECVFDLLYRYPFEPGDLGCGFDRHDHQMQFIDKQSDDLSLHRLVPRFFHLQIPVLREIRAAFPGHAIARVQIDSDLAELPMSEQLLSEVPMYRFGGTTVVRSDVFDVLEPYIDWLYFTHSAEEHPKA
jgi:hypothetical protein